MKIILALVLGSVVGAAVVDMCKDEARTRLGRVPLLLIRLAARRVPRNDQAELQDEWEGELAFILRGTEGLPVTRLIRGLAYAVDLLVRGAPRVAREIRADAAAVSGHGDAEDATWASLFPEGRHIFYEGADPTEFVRRIKVEYGFDPAADPRWGETYEGEENGTEWISYSFHCPAQHLDAIYGNPDFAMGS